jgi:hypothetical protein
MSRIHRGPRRRRGRERGRAVACRFESFVFRHLSDSLASPVRGRLGEYDLSRLLYTGSRSPPHATPFTIPTPAPVHPQCSPLLVVLPLSRVSDTLLARCPSHLRRFFTRGAQGYNEESAWSLHRPRRSALPGALGHLFADGRSAQLLRTVTTKYARFMMSPWRGSPVLMPRRIYSRFRLGR